MPLSTAQQRPSHRAGELLAEVVREQEDEAFISLQSQRLDEHKPKIGAVAKLSQKSVLQNAKAEFDSRWSDLTGRLGLVDAKVSIKMLNTRLQPRKARTLNVRVRRSA